MPEQKTLFSSLAAAATTVVFVVGCSSPMFQESDLHAIYQLHSRGVNERLISVDVGKSSSNEPERPLTQDTSLVVFLRALRDDVLRIDSVVWSGKRFVCNVIEENSGGPEQLALTSDAGRPAQGDSVWFRILPCSPARTRLTPVSQVLLFGALNGKPFSFAMKSKPSAAAPPM